MSKNMVAKATISIGAPKSKVWEALVTPDAIKQYMFGTDVEADWTHGSAITWTGEMKGKKYQDEGVILKMEPEQTLQYSHFSSLSGAVQWRRLVRFEALAPIRGASDEGL